MIFYRYHILSLILGPMITTMGCAKGSNVLTPFQLEGRKALVFDQYRAVRSPSVGTSLLRLAEKWLPSSWTGEDAILPARIELAVLVNEVCARNTPNFNFLGATSPQGSSVEKGEIRRSPVQTWKVVLDRNLTVAQIESAAQATTCVEGVSFHQVAVPTQVDPMLHDQKHFGAIGGGVPTDSKSSLVPSTENSTAPVIVAIIDTGVDVDHPDLRAHMWMNSAEVNGAVGVDDDENGYVDDIFGYNFGDRTADPRHQIVNDHGTHVAGLAAAVGRNGLGGAGVMSQNVAIMALNVYGRHWGAETQHIDEAIRYAADNGAQVINISMGSPGRSDTTGAAIAYALNRGAVVVTSAGNISSNIDENFFFPASYAATYRGMFAVTATDVGTGKLCDFSDKGPRTIRISAPGCDQTTNRGGLLSTRSGNRYGYKKGTSQAAPLVAGAVARVIYSQLKTVGARMSPVEVEQFLERSALIDNTLIDAIEDGRKLKIGNQ